MEDQKAAGEIMLTLCTKCTMALPLGGYTFLNYGGMGTGITLQT